MDSNHSPQAPGPSTPRANEETREKVSLSTLDAMKAYLSSGETLGVATTLPATPGPTTRRARSIACTSGTCYPLTVLRKVFNARRYTGFPFHIRQI